MMIQGIIHDANQLDVNPCFQIQRHALYSPEKIAMVYGSQKYTYGALIEEVRRWAAHFDEAGVKQGDRVGYIGMNSRSFIFAMLGAWWIGAVFIQGLKWLSCFSWALHIPLWWKAPTWEKLRMSWH